MEAVIGITILFCGGCAWLIGAAGVSEDLQQEQLRLEREQGQPLQEEPEEFLEWPVPTEYATEEEPPAAEPTTETIAWPDTPEPGPSEPLSYQFWTDKTGSFEVYAAFRGTKDGVVTLKKSDGTTIHVPLEKLSDADLQWIADQ